MILIIIKTVAEEFKEVNHVTKPCSKISKTLIQNVQLSLDANADPCAQSNRCYLSDLRKTCQKDVNIYNAGEFTGLFNMLPKCYRSVTKMLPCPYYINVTMYASQAYVLLLLRLENHYQTVTKQRQHTMFRKFKTICTRPALQAVEWGLPHPIDLSTFPPLCIPAHSWFPPGLSRSYSNAKLNHSMTYVTKISLAHVFSPKSKSSKSGVVNSP